MRVIAIFNFFPMQDFFSSPRIGIRCLSRRSEFEIIISFRYSDITINGVDRYGTGGNVPSIFGPGDTITSIPPLFDESSRVPPPGPSLK